VAGTRTRKTNDGALLLPAVVAALLFFWLLTEISAHPAVFAALCVLALAAAAGWVVWWWRRRQRMAVEARQQWEIEVARSTEIARYHAMSPKDFEHALALLCRRDGCSAVRVTGGAGDLGADIVAVAPDGRRIVLQAKRYGPTSKVNSPDLQRFGGTCFTVHGAAVAAVVTTSGFTRQARDYAGHMGIRLFDEHGLAGWASRTGPAPWHW
jgi:restriction system protein